MRRFVAVWLLAAHLAVPLLGEMNAAAVEPVTGPLKIAILEGEGAMNNIGQRAARDLVVQVTLENGDPVPGAVVSVVLPAQGASGAFVNGTASTTLTTDPRGRAVVSGLQPNRIPGRMEIPITASHQGLIARTTVTQFNMLVQAERRKPVRGKTTALLLLLGAAAAAGGYLALHKSSPAAAPSLPPTPPIGITPGTGTVGIP